MRAWLPVRLDAAQQYGRALMPTSMDNPNYQNLLVPFAERVRHFMDGKDSPRHYLERCLNDIASRDTGIKAFEHLDPEGARRAADDASVRFRARRPLSLADGMPVGIKDIIETRDMPTEMNSPIFKGFRPRRDAASVSVLKKAGAVIIGKTATAEFACGRSAATRNPHDLTRTPGGSSSGSAAAVGGGLIPGALGTQSQASVIRPASYCGCFAMKPSHGVLSVDGVAPLSPTLDHLGVFAASIEDLWTLLVVTGSTGLAQSGQAFGLTGEAPAAQKPATLIRLSTKGWAETDEETHTAFEKSLKDLHRLGVHIISAKDSAEVADFESELAAADAAAALIYAVEAQWPLRSYESCGTNLVGARVYELLSVANKATDADFREALTLRRRLIERLNALSKKADGFVTLSSSGPAIQDITYTGSRSFAVLWTLFGAPTFSLPVLSSQRLPVGLQLMGAYGEDLKTFSVARWVTERLRHQPNGERA
jgi:Asp-tRNA(Asn)/Glu-tRNA(Gln) amidotransferase A subunit family amidase